jgi:1,4-dihydroxy-2-naphthoate octaprenyltransferase
VRRWWNAAALLALALVFCVSLALLSTVIGATSPWLGLLLMFYFLSLAKVAEPLFMLRMPKVLRPLRGWEMDGDVLRRLRVPSFGRVLRRTPLRYLNSAVYFDRQRRDALRVRLQAESAEASHFWAAILFMPLILLAAITQNWSVAGWFLVAQVIVNVYPILHLRHVRGRLDRAMRRSSAARVGECMQQSRES